MFSTRSRSSLVLTRIQRVGKAGYIETPNAIFERLNPYHIHLLEVMNINDTLIINKKPAPRPDLFLNEIELIKHSSEWNSFFYGKPKLFHVQYLWKDKIDFKILNPDVSSGWFVDPNVAGVGDEDFATSPTSNGLRSMGLSALRKWHRLRKKKVYITQLLACPECHGSLITTDEVASCENCQVSYSLSPVPDFNRPLNVDKSPVSLRQFA